MTPTRTGNSSCTAARCTASPTNTHEPQTRPERLTTRPPTVSRSRTQADSSPKQSVGRSSPSSATETARHTQAAYRSPGVPVALGVVPDSGGGSPAGCQAGCLVEELEQV